MAGLAEDVADGRKPNIVFILADDLGWSDVGYNGSSFYETPNIDHLAGEGVRFSNAYAACPVCSPTRASIITGQYPARLGLTDWLPGRRDAPFQMLKNVASVQHLPYNQRTLPRVLKEQGYRTAIFGKWHLGEDAQSTEKQGFDLHVPDWNAAGPRTYYNPYKLKGLEGGAEGEYLTDRLTDEALAWISTNKDKPFFLYLAHFAVHDPIEGRPDQVAEFERKLRNMEKNNGASSAPPYILEANPDDPDPLSRDKLASMLDGESHRGFTYLPHRTVKIKQRQDNPEFAAMVKSVDDSVGRVRARLRDLGLAENTIIIFFSDNGGMSAANYGKRVPVPGGNLNKGFSTSNLPLRGGKGWLYEGGIREPLVIYWPHAGKHGTECNVPVISTDFYSTILDMLGIRPVTNEKNGMDGMSLVPLLKGNQQDASTIAQRALFWHWPHYSNHGAQSPGSAVRLGDYKLIEYFEHHSVQLFNLRNDPGEQNDLSKAQPEKAAQLRSILHGWRKEVGARMMEAKPGYDPAKWRWPGEANR